MTAIWKKEELVNRSLQGGKCPWFPGKATKNQLSPWKADVMRGKSLRFPGKATKNQLSPWKADVMRGKS
ncbi:hypothetical protein V5799_007149 [Amblyomma americanum]|uniref:Uncharacterized protein n=1 Tax=Amblyomma americanum TaxID=6943 RepID=A0AAQ4DUC9_AMBAM